MALTMDLKPRLSATMASLSSSVTSERPKTTSVMEHANNHGGSPLIRQSRHDMRVEYLMLRHEQLELCLGIYRVAIDIAVDLRRSGLIRRSSRK
jgi:hypothetical protein